MPETNRSVPSIGSDPQPAAPDRTVTADSWLSRNIAPILALLTVILTFCMFAFFIIISSLPGREVRNFLGLQRSLSDARLGFSQASSAIGRTRDFAGLENRRREIDRLTSQLTASRIAAEDAKERRAMVKDFILYILGVLSSVVTTIFGYYFGSSKGSAVKSETLHVLARTVKPADPTGGE